MPYYALQDVYKRQGVYNTLADSYIQSGMDNCGAILNMLPTDEMNTSWEHTWRQQDLSLIHIL